ncbi:MAG TPA: hypothetical protein VG871_08115 [Vicinamibacterales bacterium]|nr:hypothetical protein [Vicinamibacterales bacterium]
MTRGTLMIRIGQRLVGGDIFDAVVAPAIADLQFEAASAGLLACARGYAGVWRAIAGGITRDIGGDLRLLTGDTTTLAALVLVQVGYYGFLATFLLNLMRHH